MTINQNSENKAQWVDVLIIGGGFGGMRMLQECRELGLEAVVLESGSELGGTWHWNRYPGARTDTESWAYCFFFDEELNTNYEFKERYATQQQSLDYLNYVADALDMRQNMRFGERVSSASYDEAKNDWCVTTDNGEHYRCRYLVSASGLLSVPYKPPFKNAEVFEGETYLTGNWPKEPVEFANKRVAVVGAGATAVQVIPIVAHEASEVTVFQRTPNYVLPARNYPVTDAHQREIRASRKEIFKQCRNQVFAFPMQDAKRSLQEYSAEEQQRILEWGWEIGGFQFAFETFNDILMDRDSNQVVAEFVRNKIRAIVKDPKTAELLCPDHALFAKRPPLGHFYYEAYNRSNVTLVDVSQDPIEEITPRGLKTHDREFGDFDILIFATGFDAGTGALANIDVRGRQNQSLAETWNKAVETHLGICMNGFPNFFMISGPQAPFANTPMIIHKAVDWIGLSIRHLRRSGNSVIEARQETCHNWAATVKTVLDATVLADGANLNSWFVGRNIAGKLATPLFYFGGANNYFDEIDKEIQADFPGLEVSNPDTEIRPRVAC